MENTIEKYCRTKSALLAAKIEQQFYLIVKPKPWYCPLWLYKKIIKESVEIINNPSSLTHP
jgi:hypothetical protein